MEEKDKLIKQLADDYNEAIAEIRFNMSTIGLKENSVKRVVKARDLAIKALEKQIPKKPITHSNTNRSDCPCCGATVRGIKNPFGDWCSNCGQKLDWSDEE